MARNTKNPGVFAAAAQTTIPATPVVGIAYRDLTTALATIEGGWPFKTIVNSPEFAQFLHELSTLTDLVDRTGILEWKDDVEYDIVPAYVQGSDGALYKSLQASGPATAPRDPTSQPTYWELFDLTQYEKFGLGIVSEVLIPDIDDNTQAAGLYHYDPGSSGVKPTITGTVLVIRIAATHCTQLAHDSATDDLYTRTFIGGTWSTWNPINIATIGDASQTWQNVTGSRTSGVTYTNTTGVAIFFTLRSGISDSFDLLIDGIGHSSVSQTGSNSVVLSFIIPDGSTYTPTFSGGATIYELR